MCLSLLDISIIYCSVFIFVEMSGRHFLKGRKCVTVLDLYINSSKKKGIIGCGVCINTQHIV